MRAALEIGQIAARYIYGAVRVRPRAGRGVRASSARASRRPARGAASGVLPLAFVGCGSESWRMETSCTA
eukprot:COSAG02_NODE_4967_length_4773_cov_44.423834_12_plen_70_part_00